MAQVRTISFTENDTEILEWLEQTSQETGLSLSHLVRTAVRAMMRDGQAEQGQLDRIEEVVRDLGVKVDLLVRRKDA